MKFYVLGDEDVILGFQFIGIKGSIVENSDEASKEFDKIAGGIYSDVGVVLITEKVNIMIEEKIMNWQINGEYPLIVLIPDLSGHIEGRKTLLQSIREAVGLHV